MARAAGREFVRVVTNLRLISSTEVGRKLESIGMECVFACIGSLHSTSPWLILRGK
jgi:hypothetical protein